RLPVTEEIAGSNPVGRAKKIYHLWMVYFLGIFDAARTGDRSFSSVIAGSVERMKRKKAPKVFSFANEQKSEAISDQTSKKLYPISPSLL
ncbi:MAG TPA: hypothetical protein PKD19_03850, partial [Candidatus Saccharibacteria bacterium]|nr:hypothetical protein [Candidatus Saccharibacteria bacterium]